MGGEPDGEPSGCRADDLGRADIGRRRVEARSGDDAGAVTRRTLGGVRERWTDLRVRDPIRWVRWVTWVEWARRRHAEAARQGVGHQRQHRLVARWIEDRLRQQ